MHRSFFHAKACAHERLAVSRVGFASLAGLIVLIAGGCQSYERRPLDLAGQHAAFLARTPESPDVGAFANSLAARMPDTPGFDTADSLTLAEAELIALVFNADLRVARLRAGVTRATAENAGLWEDPTIGVDLTCIIESTPDLRRYSRAWASRSRSPGAWKSRSSVQGSSTPPNSRGLRSASGRCVCLFGGRGASGQRSMHNWQ
jgi:hypothetical protein